MVQHCHLQREVVGCEYGTAQHDPHSQMVEVEGNSAEGRDGQGAGLKVEDNDSNCLTYRAV